jgi:hypothetical protein
MTCSCGIAPWRSVTNGVPHAIASETTPGQGLPSTNAAECMCSRTRSAEMKPSTCEIKGEKTGGDGRIREEMGGDGRRWENGKEGGLVEHKLAHSDVAARLESRLQRAVLAAHHDDVHSRLRRAQVAHDTEHAHRCAPTEEDERGAHAVARRALCHRELWRVSVKRRMDDHPTCGEDMRWRVPQQRGLPLQQPSADNDIMLARLAPRPPIDPGMCFSGGEVGDARKEHCRWACCE